MHVGISSLRVGTVIISFAVALTSLQLARPAAAQTTPKFEFAKPEEVKVVEWKAQAKGGVLVTTGNSRTTNGSLGASASRKEGGNKLTLDGTLAYGKSTVFAPVFGDAMNPTQITDLEERSVQTTNSWLVRGRYDRFFTLKYDQNPAPRPVPSGSPAGTSYAATFLPFADKVDTLTEATLVYTFL